MTKLSDTQAVILSAAAQSDGHKAPLPRRIAWRGFRGAGSNHERRYRFHPRTVQLAHAATSPRAAHPVGGVSG